LTPKLIVLGTPSRNPRRGGVLDLVASSKMKHKAQGPREGRKLDIVALER